MERFSLDNFTKKDADAPIIPGWAQRPLIKDLYLAIVKRIDEIENLIEQTDPEEVEKLKIKARKVVASQIADSLKIDRSNIREDRESELVTFIKNENARLVRLWTSRCDKLGVGQRLSKGDLEELVKQRDKELKAAEQKSLHEYFDRAVESEVLNSQKDLQDKYRELQILYKQEQERCANLETKVKQLIVELNRPK